jgi:hypothetical protein
MIFDVDYNILDKTIAWSITIALSFIVGILFLILARNSKKTNISISQVRNAYAIFLMSWATTRIFFLLSDRELDSNGESAMYAQLLLIGYMFTIVAMTFLIYTIEKRISMKSLRLTKYLIFVCIAIAGFWVVSQFIPEIVTTAKYFTYVMAGILGLIIIVFYIWLIVKSTGSVRKLTILNSLSIILIFAGHTLDTTVISPYIKDIIWMPAIISTFGVILFYISQKSIKN